MLYGQDQIVQLYDRQGQIKVGHGRGMLGSNAVFFHDAVDICLVDRFRPKWHDTDQIRFFICGQGNDHIVKAQRAFQDNDTIGRVLCYREDGRIGRVFTPDHAPKSHIHFFKIVVGRMHEKGIDLKTVR